jgi:titin
MPVFSNFSSTLNFIFAYSVFKKNKSLKVDALSGKTVLEEKISVTYQQEEVVKERTELEIAEAKVEEVLEEEFHEVKEYFEEEEFHEVEEFIKVEERRFQEEHKVEEVHRVIEFLEAEEVEVYEKPKAPPKGIGNSADIINYYILL